MKLELREPLVLLHESCLRTLDTSVFHVHNLSFQFCVNLWPQSAIQLFPLPTIPPSILTWSGIDCSLRRKQFILKLAHSMAWVINRTQCVSSKHICTKGEKLWQSENLNHECVYVIRSKGMFAWVLEYSMRKSVVQRWRDETETTDVILLTLRVQEKKIHLQRSAKCELVISLFSNLEKKKCVSNRCLV